WGGLFALVFGMDLGVMRLSTVVAVAIGAMALYAILRMLGVSRNRSVLGTTLYLFNPLSFVLSFTFMTDPHFTSWLLVAVALYAKGLDEEHRRPWVIVLGSLAAGYAFWIRQQGALIPLAVVFFLVATRRVWFDLAGLKRVLQVAAAPAAMLVGYYVWLRWFNDVTAVQESFFDEMREAGWAGAWHLVRYLTFYELMYLGLILVPILVAIAPGWRGGERREGGGSFRTPLGYWFFLGTTGIVITGLFFVTGQGRKMPYIPQFVGSGGLGAPDVPGGRLRLIEWPEVYQVATILAAIGAIVAGLMICRTIVPEVSPQRAVAGLVAMVGLWQVVGVLPPSFHYLNRGGSLDRYLLPLIPLAIALLLWSLRDVRLFDPAGWLVLAVVAAFSVAGTRDYLVYMDAVWSMARTANAAGVPNEKLDAGSGWDGYHLYTEMLDEGVTKSRAPKGSPWWLYFYAKNSDATYVVTTDPGDYPGYVVVEKAQYDQWLENDETWVYLVRQKDAPWPPGGATAPPAAQPNAVVPTPPTPTPTPTTARGTPAPTASPAASPTAGPPTATVSLAPTATATAIATPTAAP
ncbi:MAG: glycosyltransferase family 39 protein, partial [Thermomicrobiales bacterium]